MEIIFIKEAQTSTDIVSQVKNSVISRIEQAVNAINSNYETKNSETLLLPIVPKNNPFKTLAEVKNYKGLEREYNVPTYQSLKSFSWSSFFPVNKSYSFQHAGSNINGYDYVDFLQERQINQLPFRLIAFDRDVSLLVEYPDTSYVISCEHETNSSSYSGSDITVLQKTASGFRAYSAGATHVAFSWYAAGYLSANYSV